VLGRARPSRFVLSRFVWPVSECPQEGRPVKTPAIFLVFQKLTLNQTSDYDGGNKNSKLTGVIKFPDKKWD